MEAYSKVYLYKRIVQAKLFIDAHYAESINLNNIADEAFFSKFHFIRLFRNIYGITPHHYLSGVRIAKAELLLQKGLSVTEACAQVGFDSVSSFTGLFKRHTKRTPSAYQQSFLNRRKQIDKIPLQFIPACFAQKKGWTEE